MRKELEEILFNIDPKWFNRDDLTKSLMGFGFDHGDGWFRLLKRGMTSIKQYIDDQAKYRNNNISFEVMQVKEKWGGLRFYFYGGDRVIGEYVHGMEFAASMTCELCGNSGRIRHKLMWHQTLCDECYWRLIEVRYGGQEPGQAAKEE